MNTDWGFRFEAYFNSIQKDILVFYGRDYEDATERFFEHFNTVYESKPRPTFEKVETIIRNINKFEIDKTSSEGYYTNDIMKILRSMKMEDRSEYEEEESSEYMEYFNDISEL